MLGVGRKVGSRNGSRGCCATINTPRDATRHVLLFSTFRSFFFSPSRSAASSLFPTPCACSFFFSLYYSLIPRLFLSLLLSLSLLSFSDALVSIGPLAISSSLLDSLLVFPPSFSFLVIPTCSSFFDPF